MNSPIGTVDKKKWDTSSEMIAFHMSVPYRPDSVKEKDVKQALTEGTLQNLESPAKEILTALFIENSPSIIFKASLECGSSLQTLQLLYRELTEKHFIRSLDWEKTFSVQEPPKCL